MAASPSLHTVYNTTMVKVIICTLQLPQMLHLWVTCQGQHPAPSGNEAPAKKGLLVHYLHDLSVGYHQDFGGDYFLLLFTPLPPGLFTYYVYKTLKKKKTEYTVAPWDMSLILSVT